MKGGRKRDPSAVHACAHAFTHTHKQYRRPYRHTSFDHDFTPLCTQHKHTPGKFDITSLLSADKGNKNEYQKVSVSGKKSQKNVSFNFLPNLVTMVKVNTLKFMVSLNKK